MSIADACTWSAPEVAAYFRNQLLIDIAWIPNVSLFDVDSLATKLQEDDVAGFALLDDIDKRVLREDYGVKSRIVRSAITWAIGDLRKKSAIFNKQQQDDSQSPAPPRSQASPSRVASLPAPPLHVGTNTRGTEFIAEDAFRCCRYRRCAVSV